jgi:hypothetical protein
METILEPSWHACNSWVGPHKVGGRYLMFSHIYRYLQRNENKDLSDYEKIRTGGPL